MKGVYEMVSDFEPLVMVWDGYSCAELLGCLGGGVGEGDLVGGRLIRLRRYFGRRQVVVALVKTRRGVLFGYMPYYSPDDRYFHYGEIVGLQGFLNLYLGNGTHSLGRCPEPWGRLPDLGEELLRRSLLKNRIPGTSEGLLRIDVIFGSQFDDFKGCISLIV